MGQRSASVLRFPGVEGVRVSDEQREDAARQLREHFADGRVTQDELDERLQATYAARTESDLRALLADLPRLPASPAQERAELVARRRHLQRRMIQEAGGGLVVFMICTVVWAASGAQGQFWPIWIAVVVLIPLLRNGWRLYGPAPQLDRVERELDRRAHRGRRRHR